MENEVTTTESGDFGEFFSEFSGAENQSTEETTETTEEATETETTAEAEESEHTDENSEDENTNDSTEDGAEAEDGADKPADEQTYTVKVDGKESQVKIDELISGYQKGQAFDRVKNQLAEARNTIAQMKADSDANAETLDLINAVAKKAGTDVNGMLKTFFSGLVLGNGGSNGQADAEFENLQLQMKLDKQNAKETEAAKTNDEDEAKAKAESDIADFRKAFPDVEITSELIKSLESDLKDGVSLTSAYRAQQSKKQAAEIERLQKELKAAQKNAKNRVSSPGSQKDTGGSKNTGFSEFFSFFGS